MRSGFIFFLFALHFAQQPDLCKFPIVHHGADGDVQHFGGFLHAETAEKAQFDRLCFPGIDSSQRVESIVQLYNIGIPADRNGERFFKRQLLDCAAPFGAAAPTRVIDQHATHQLGGEGKKMSPILP